MSKHADHAEILKALRANSDGEDICGYAANLIEWQAKEIRHLARKVGDQATLITEQAAKIAELTPKETT